MNNPPINLGDTRPNPAVRLHQRRRRLSLPLIFLITFFMPVFCCGLTLLTYLVFPPAHVDVLILGVDGRGAEGFVSRTDSIMLLGINPARLRTSIVSFPRDLFIDVPGYGAQRINTVNVLGEQQKQGGGPELLSAAISQDFGVQADRYARLDFQGFVELIDAVGGITIDVERSIVDDNYPTEDGGVTTIRFESGVQHMDGERALIYARTRHADDDYQRAARQQQVVSALLGRMAIPVYWPAAISVLNRFVETDLTVIDMALLAPPVLLNIGRYERLVIDRDYIVGGTEGVVPNYEKILPWLVERFE